MWCSSNCGNFLAFVHLLNGVTLMMIDVSTDYASNNPYDTSLGYLFIVCAIISFITTRRLDRCVLQALATFSFFSLTSAMFLFVDNMIFVSNQCIKEEQCSSTQQIVHSQIAFIGLCEVASSIASLLLCYRSKLDPEMEYVQMDKKSQNV